MGALEAMEAVIRGLSAFIGRIEAWLMSGGEFVAIPLNEDSGFVPDDGVRIDWPMNGVPMADGRSDGVRIGGGNAAPYSGLLAKGLENPLKGFWLSGCWPMDWVDGIGRMGVTEDMKVGGD